MENIEVARAILRALSRPESLLKFVADRLGHDRRYALDCAKLSNQLGWNPEYDFDRGLAATVRWYHENTSWLQEARSGEYQKYFERHYVRRAETLAAPAKMSS